MKFSLSFWSLAFAAACAAAIPAASGRAEPLYWSASGTSQGGAGTWNTSSQRWGSLPFGPFNQTWNNADLDTAIFTGTSGTVTLAAPIAVGGLTFLSSSGYTLTTGTFGLSFDAANNTLSLLNSSNGATSSATITGSVGGTGNVVVTSINPVVAATLTFNGTSAGGWSGSTTVGQNATVALAASSRALVNTSGIVLAGGGITLTNVSAAEAALNRVSDSAAITSRGGSITFTNTSGTMVYAETLGSVGLTNGQLNVVLSTNQAGTGSQSLVLSALSRSGASNASAVTFSAGGGLNTTKNMISVTGVAATSAGQIIGPWATIGTAAAAQTDYAVYNGSAQIVAAAITASAETTWTAATDAYTLSAGTTLTADRTIAALRYTGVAASLDLGTSSLRTSGLLNGGSGLLTVSSGTLTTASGGGQLHLTAGNNAITVSSRVADNGGAVTLVKNGASALTLSNTTNSYTGGTVLNSGTLAIGNVNNIGGANANLTFGGNASLAPSATLNFSGGTLTVNEGANAVITANGTTTFATTAGAGNLIYETTSVNRVLNLGNASGFTGDLEVRLAGNANYNTATTIQFSSLGDGVGSGLQFVGGTTDSNQALTIVLSGGSSPLVFDNRQIQTLPRIASNNSPRYAGLSNNNANAANTWTINTDLDWGFSGSNNNRELRLGGSNTGDNAFNGLLSQGNAVERLFLSKIDAGKWILGHTANTYDGFTDIRAGTLEIKSVADGGVASSIGASGTAAANLVLAANTTLLYSGTGHSTNRSFTISGSNAAVTIASSGAGAINFTSSATPAYGTVNEPKSLILGGTNSGDNTLAAVIANNGTGAVRVTKNGIGTWILTGANTYSGTTSVTAGTLLLNGDGSAAVGAVSVTGGTLGGIGTIGGTATFSGTTFLSPGSGGLGQLTVGGLRLGNLTTTTLELSGTTPGSLYDGMRVLASGTLSYDGSLSVVNFGGFDMDAESFTYGLFDFGGSTVPAGAFDAVTVAGVSLTNAGGVWTGTKGPDVTYTFTQSTGDLEILVVPEPATLALLGGGAAVCLALRRRLTRRS